MADLDADGFNHGALAAVSGAISSTGPLEGRWDNPLGARALYLFVTTRTRLSASTAPTSHRKSEGTSLRAASVCATWTRSTS